MTSFLPFLLDYVVKAIRRILALYEGVEPCPKSVVIVGHSMVRAAIYIIQREEQADSLGMAGGLGPRAKIRFLIFDLLIKIVILLALLTVSMTNILLVIPQPFTMLVFMS